MATKPITKRLAIEKNVFEFDGKDKRLGNNLAKSVISAFFSQGHLTESDLALPQDKFFKRIREILTKADLLVGVDHRSDIIGKADVLFRKKDFDYAKILYAMFFEHSINHLISHECQKRRIDEKTKVDIIKSIDIHGKFTWLLQLLNFPIFNDNHRRIIRKLSDDRNAFIHYKWKIEKDDEKNTKTENNEEEFKKIKLAVKYMKRYETHILFQKNKAKLNKKLKRK